MKSGKVVYLPISKHISDAVEYVISFSHQGDRVGFKIFGGTDADNDDIAAALVAAAVALRSGEVVTAGARR